MCTECLVHRVAVLFAKETGKEFNYFFCPRNVFNLPTYNDFHTLLTAQMLNHGKNSVREIVAYLHGKLSTMALEGARSRTSVLTYLLAKNGIIPKSREISLPEQNPLERTQLLPTSSA